MKGVNDQILRIEEKIQLLLKQYLVAQKEIQRLQKENDRLTDQLKSRTSQANQLHQKVDALKMSATSLDESTKKDLEKRINGYLKDIDRCLALLHS